MADLTGQTLGKYQILERLGRGGMADVYKGYQPGLDRYVAVKVLHPHLSEDPDFITRFRREAQRVAELHHPYIVQVFDFDVQNDNYYMVMEYIENGRTLKQLLQGLAERSKRLPIDQTIGIVLDLADALAYAHGVGMIHRDIKPANVLLPGLDRPVLGDFGIARLMGETGLTSSGMMIGTPAYMSPEQGRGERGDARSDIYALGIVLYEMLTGQPPYDADTPYAIILKHINDPLTPPHILTGPMPEAIERIVLKCLAKDAADRFATMAELREALRGAQPTIGIQQTATTSESAASTLQPSKPQPVTTVPATPAAAAVPTGRSMRSVPRPVWWIGAVVILLAVGALIVSQGLRGVSPVSSTSTFASHTPTLNALANNPTATAQLSVSTSTPQLNVPTNTPPARAPTSTPAAANDLLGIGYEQLAASDNEGAYEIFSQVLKSEPDNARAHVGRAIAELYRNGDTAQVTADLSAAAPTLQNDPFYYFALGLQHGRSDQHLDLSQAENDFAQAIDQCGNNAPLCAGAYFERAQLRAWNLDNPQGALEDVDHVLELASEPIVLGDAYAIRAAVEYESLGNLSPAIDDLRHAYQVNPWPGYLERAAQYAVHAKNYAPAIDVYNQLLDEEKGDPRLLAGRAYVEWRAGDAEKARQSTERALQLDPKLLEAHYLMGLLLLDAQQPKDALAELLPISSETNQDALDQMSQPFLNPDFGHEIFYDMARAESAAGDPAAAQEYLTKSLQFKDDWPQSYILRAQILKDQGDLAGARENYLKALDYANDPDLKAAIEKALTDLAK
jgi:serine/threonine protein kinase